jgi:Leucine-rich repeat (LRR) protein
MARRSSTISYIPKSAAAARTASSSSSSPSPPPRADLQHGTLPRSPPASATSAAWDAVASETEFQDLWAANRAVSVTVLRSPGIGLWRLPLMSATAVTTLVLEGCGLTQLPEALLDGLHLLQCLELPKNNLRVLHENVGAWARLAPTLLKLCLPQNALRVLPQSLSLLTRLVSVDVSKNELVDLSPLYPLASLRLVLADSNLIAELPARAFDHWTGLRSLSLDENQLRTMPKTLERLSDALVSLNLSKNFIKNIPPSLLRLTSLQSLSLHSNDLSILPVLFGSLKSLEVLLISRNRIKAFPPSIAELVRLQRLDASSNHISEIPDGLFFCTALRRLHLERNEIGAVPPQITSLTSLIELNLEGNPMFEPLDPLVHAALRHQCTQMLRLPYLPTLGLGSDMDLGGATRASAGGSGKSAYARAASLSRMKPVRLGSKNKIEAQRPRRLASAAFSDEEPLQVSELVSTLHAGVISASEMERLLTALIRPLSNLTAARPPPSNSVVAAAAMAAAIASSPHSPCLAGIDASAISLGVLYEFLIRDGLQALFALLRDINYLPDMRVHVPRCLTLLELLFSQVAVDLPYRPSRDDLQSVVLLWKVTGDLDAVLRVLNLSKSAGNTLFTVLVPVLDDVLQYATQADARGAGLALSLVNEALASIDSPAARREARRQLQQRGIMQALKTLKARPDLALDERLCNAIRSYADASRDDMEEWNEISQRNLRAAFDRSILADGRALATCAPISPAAPAASSPTVPQRSDASPRSADGNGSVRRAMLVHSKRTSIARGASRSAAEIADCSSSLDSSSAGSPRLFAASSQASAFSPSLSSNRFSPNTGSSDNAGRTVYILVVSPFAATEDDIIAKIVRKPNMRVKDVLSVLKRLGKPLEQGPFQAALYLQADDAEEVAGMWLSRDVVIDSIPGAELLDDDLPVQLRLRPSDIPLRVFDDGMVVAMKLDPEKTIRENLCNIVASHEEMAARWASNDCGMFLANPAFSVQHGIALPEAGIWMHDTSRLKEYASRLGGDYDVILRLRPLPVRISFAGGVSETIWLDQHRTTVAKDVVAHSGTLFEIPTGRLDDYTLALPGQTDSPYYFAASVDEARDLLRRTWMLPGDAVDPTRVQTALLRVAPGAAHVTVVVDGVNALELDGFLDLTQPVQDWFDGLLQYIGDRLKLAQRAVLRDRRPETVVSSDHNPIATRLLLEMSLRNQGHGGVRTLLEIQYFTTTSAAADVGPANRMLDPSSPCVWAEFVLPSSSFRDETGALQAASLGFLVALLLHPKSAPPNFQEVFFRMVSFFAAPVEVLYVLCRDGYELLAATAGPALSDADMVAVQKRLFLLLAHWVDTDPDVVTPSFAAVLDSFLERTADCPGKNLLLEHFCGPVPQPNSSGILPSAVPPPLKLPLALSSTPSSSPRLLSPSSQGALSSSIPAMPSSPTSTSSPPPVSPLQPTLSSQFFWALDEEDLARQLCIAAFSHFDGIRMSDFLHKGWENPRSHSLRGVVALVNRVAAWVTSTVVQEETLNSRARLLARHIRTAHALIEMRNFQVAMAYVIAWNSAPLSRLRWTFGKLPRPVRAMKDRVDQLLDPRGSFKNYRAALASAAKPCVPFLGCIFVDLTFCEDGNADRICGGLIHWYKYELLHRIVLPVFDYQGTPYAYSQVSAVQSFLEQLPAITAEEQFQCSLAREPRNASRGEVI